MNKDLTVGKPSKVLWAFCLPLFASIIFQQLYNIADSLVAGKFIGENALAAVGNSYEVTLLFLAFAFGCNIGCSVIVSSFFGSKNYNEVRTTVTTTIISTLILCLILMILGYFLSPSLLKLIKTPDVVFADSMLYLKIYILGLPFVFFYNIANGIFSGLGDSKTPFYFLAISSITNIFMDILFVTVFKMGIAGVAWATFICQGFSCLISWIFVYRRLNKLIITNKVLFSFSILKRIAKIAIPSILQQSFISVGNIIIQGVINSFGSSVMAGYSAGIKLNNLVITSFTTLCNGVSNYTAQNLGANKIERLHEGFKAGLKIIWILCIPLVSIYFIFGKYLLLLFMKEASPEALRSGIYLLRILAPFYFVISLKFVIDGILRGASLMKQFMTSTFIDLIIRVVLSILLARTDLGYVGIWCSWPVGWSVAAILSVIFYLKAPWKKKEQKIEIE